MLCILHMEDSRIAGWVIAPDMPTARRMIHDAQLQQALDQVGLTPPPGKHELLDGKYVMLVAG